MSSDIKTVCSINTCTGCGACVNRCSKNAIDIVDNSVAYNAVIEETKCIHCGACHMVCPNNTKQTIHVPIEWYEGYSRDNREYSSSGAAAYALMHRFINDGGCVASCLFKGGEFIYEITDDINDLSSYIGSKYVKSNPAGIYQKVLDKLNDNKSVLFIGLPCQVAGLKNYIGHKSKNLYTVDLICHGTPSPRLLDMYLKENKIDLGEIKDIKFRKKGRFGIEVKTDDQYVHLIHPRIVDFYTYAFLTGIDYTDNCYSCKYANIKRISDITIGDSWGSTLDDKEKAKGISLMLCQTQKGINLLKSSNIELMPVNLDEAIAANHQLEMPSVRTEKTQVFFENLDKGFTYAYKNADKIRYYKVRLKEMLIRLRVI